MAEAKKPSTKKNPSVAKARERASTIKTAGSGQVAGFVKFIREQGVVGLAVGLAIGTAAGATVKTIVEGFITPIVRLIVGTKDELESAVWHVNISGREADFAWGAVVSSLITLTATAFVIYLIIHFAKLDRLDRKKS